MKVFISGQANAFLVIGEEAGELHRLGTGAPITIPMKDWRRAFASVTDIAVLDVDDVTQAEGATKYFRNVDLATRYVLTLLDPDDQTDDHYHICTILEGLLERPGVPLGVESFLYSRPLTSHRYPDIFTLAEPFRRVQVALLSLFENQERIRLTRAAFDNLLQGSANSSELMARFESIAIQQGLFREFVSGQEEPARLLAFIDQLTTRGFDSVYLAFCLNWASAIPALRPVDAALQALFENRSRHAFRAVTATNSPTSESPRTSPFGAISKRGLPLPSPNPAIGALPNTVDMTEYALKSLSPWTKPFNNPLSDGLIWPFPMPDRRFRVVLADLGPQRERVIELLLTIDLDAGKKRETTVSGFERVIVADHLSIVEAAYIRDLIEGLGGTAAIIGIDQK